MKLQRKAPPPLALSIALHLVFGAVLVRVLTMPLPLSHWFDLDRGSQPAVERISFIALPKAGAVTTAGRSGGDGRPVTKTPSPPPAPLRAPTSVPTAIPGPSTAAVQPSGGSGEIVGAGGPTAGIRPSYNDPRLWVPPAPVVSLPRTQAERLDSALTTRLRAHRDSVALATHLPNKAERGDWTVERNGKKYGIDQKYIHLGGFQLPTAALALLPLNRTANPGALERERAYNYMHGDIAFQAQRAMNEDEFRNAVRSIRQRKERERVEAAKQGVVATERNR